MKLAYAGLLVAGVFLGSVGGAAFGPRPCEVQAKGDVGDRILIETRHVHMGDGEKDSGTVDLLAWRMGSVLSLMGGEKKDVDATNFAEASDFAVTLGEKNSPVIQYRTRAGKLEWVSVEDIHNAVKELNRKKPAPRVPQFIRPGEEVTVEVFGCPCGGTCDCGAPCPCPKAGPDPVLIVTD